MSIVRITPRGVNSYSKCAELNAHMITVYDTKTKLTMRTSVEDQGIRSDLSAQAVLPNDTLGKYIKAGEYQLKMLTDGCDWLSMGSETIKPDGTGQYQISDDAEECTLYQVRYSETDSIGRDACDENMQAFELRNSSCILLNWSGTGFDCLFTYASDDRQIYRYILDQ